MDLARWQDHLNRGVEFLGAGEWGAAETEFLAAEQLERYPEAVETQERAITANSENAEAHYLLGHAVLDGRGEAARKRARALLERALELEPANERFRAAVGRMREQ